MAHFSKITNESCHEEHLGPHIQCPGTVLKERGPNNQFRLPKTVSKITTKIGAHTSGASFSEVGAHPGHTPGKRNHIKNETPVRGGMVVCGLMNP